MREVLTAPTLIRELAHGAEHFTTIDDLAARVDQLRARRGLQLIRCVAAWGDLPQFGGVNIYAQPRSGDPEWIGVAAMPDGRGGWHGPAELNAALLRLREQPRKAA